MTDIRHRKALKTAAIDLHRLATDIRQRRGHVPPDQPAGYLAAFSTHLRSMARLCETARDMSCAQAKRHALGTPRPEGEVEALGHQRAVNALLVLVNLHAGRAGLDPYEGMRPGDKERAS